MEGRDAVKYAAYYHVLALFSAVVGYAIILVGFWVGLGGALAQVSLTEPLAALGAAKPLPLFAGLIVGLLVKRIGQTAAYLKIQTGAIEENVDVPSTSVISRKVGTEVSNAITGGEGDGDGSGFEYADEESGEPASESTEAPETGSTNDEPESTGSRETGTTTSGGEP